MLKALLRHQGHCMLYYCLPVKWLLLLLLLRLQGGTDQRGQVSIGRQVQTPLTGRCKIPYGRWQKIALVESKLRCKFEAVSSCASHR